MKHVMRTFPVIILFLNIIIYSGVAQVPIGPKAHTAILKYDPIVKAIFDEKNLPYGNPVFIRIFKESYELELWIKEYERYYLLKTYTICNYSGGLGPKKKKGDGMSPEGFYKLQPALMNPKSTYWLSMDIGYPNDSDRLQGCTGGSIMIHGKCCSNGCYAMGDETIEEIWTIVAEAFSKGQNSIPVHIFPFRMSIENLERFGNSEYIEFWGKLKEVYDLFSENQQQIINQL